MSNLRKLLSLFLVVVLMFPISGCYDRVELEGMAFVVSLGLDKGPDNTIDVTARIAVPSKLSGGTVGGGGGGGKDEELGGTKPITVRAHSIGEALTLLNTTVERQISLMHLASIGIGESLAREGVINYLRPLARYREFRRTVVLYVMPGNVREVYEKNQPILERSVTRFTESVTEVGRHTGLGVTNKLHEFIVSLETPNEDPIAAVLALNPKAKEQVGEREESELSFEPGKVVRQGGNPLEFTGTAVFQNDRLVTYLDGIDTRMLLTIRGELRRTQMDFPDPFEKERFVSLELKHARAPVVKVDLTTDPIRVKIRQRLEGDLIGTQTGLDYTKPSDMNILEKSIAQRLAERQKKLIEHIYHEYQADPFGILKRTRGQFATFPDLKAFDFRTKLQDAEVDVEVDLQVRRVGIQLSPLQPK
ncbi:Ger(x)C family spore germination protein [Effusibacillus consociatus]|uniref:Ger(X)C family spore germination protein n=1 Tax=Effusibacillus consociatus TaxID=1117041 RepID=A0ABV9Q4R0_9BACL